MILLKFLSCDFLGVKYSRVFVFIWYKLGIYVPKRISYGLEKLLMSAQLDCVFLLSIF